MREGLRHDTALRAPLQRVVADRGGRLQGLLQFTGLDHALSLHRPYSGVAVGL